MYLINVYVPEDAAEQVKAAMFAAGAGKLGQYDQVAWQTLGTGQFRPLAGSDPAIGKQGQLTYVQEYKVEMLCEESALKGVIAALKEAHPYEEPAYQIMEVKIS
jgi:hypothetical protein